MKKRLIIIFSLILAVVLFVVLGGTLSGDSPDDVKTQQNPKIYIGVFEPYSGVNALGGEQETLGLEYAKSIRPSVYIGGVTYDISFVTADNASEVNAAKSAAEYLVTSEVSAVLGSYGTTVSLAGAEIFKNAGIPSINISCKIPSDSDEAEDYFSICYSDAFQGSVLAKFAYGQGLRNVAVLSQAGDIYSKGLGSSFTSEFERLEGKVEAFSFNSGQTNYEDLIKNISKAGVDAVFIPSPCSIGTAFINQAREADFFKPIIGGDTWDSQTLVSETLAAGKDVYFSSAFNSEGASGSTASSFAAKFSQWLSNSEDRLEKNGGNSYTTPVAALAYDAYMILCDAIEAADSSKPADITAALRLIKHAGVTGEHSLADDEGNSKKTAYIKSIDVRGECFELIQTYHGN